MLTSFCIKTNNKYVIDYLLSEFENARLENIYISTHKFKIYNNIIVHYKGDENKAFVNFVCDCLANSIIDCFEYSLLKKMINSNYFYFSDIEKKEILNNCVNLLDSPNDIMCRKNSISSSFINFLNETNCLILDGFINFRLQEYVKFLDSSIDLSVDKFLLDKEYNEFISLLKLYVSSKDAGASLIHLVYMNGTSILLDKNKKIIDTNNNIFNAKYLSDITFSSNDYALNTLLNIVPEKLYVHLIDLNEDEFITTLRLIFENRFFICKDCPICNIYKFSNNIKKQQ